jgi:superfamily II DNA or RNA helicase
MRSLVWPVVGRGRRGKGRLIQYAGRILRPYPGLQTAEVHDYQDARTGVLAATLVGRAPGRQELSGRGRQAADRRV